MPTFYYIIPAAISLAAVVMAFCRRLPAAAVAFVSMLGAAAFGWAVFPTGQYWFWGIAALIVTVNLYLGSRPPLTALRLYTAGGALAGSVVGAVAGSMAALIIGGAIGAFLGFEAFRRTPAGRMNATFSQRLAIFADLAIPAMVTFFIVIITFAQLPLFR
ncbi:MAG: hypothetical protein HFJ87_06085 [Muribaculaceae bacterium]|nr:hypothetical protein [Muribaculaceae bacterium]